MDIRLEDIVTQPLPGSVAVAALGAAMGAALMGKAVRLTGERLTLTGRERTWLQAVGAELDAVRAELVQLAARDEQAVRTVLSRSRAKAEPATEASGLVSGRGVRGDRMAGEETGAAEQAWQAATETALQLAETCQALLNGVPLPEDRLWPAVRAELQTGRWLVEVGVRAGLLAAESNLRALGDGPASVPLQERIQALKKTFVEDRE